MEVRRKAMSEPVISIKNVHKEFVLNESAAASLKTLILWWKSKPAQRQLHVLKGFDLEVNSGECVALIGRNGAGKSTLLSLVANVYKPTSGEIEVNGRIAPLLELGAGFHPDLSGRENILFNAMMLGLSREDALERTESIISFAEIENQIDAPVRTYSSGMQARLGFAIAAHVDADILIVDEVLSVGDIAFEQKCFKFIDEFKESGGTVLFVSHALPTVKRASDRVVWLENGTVRKIGLAEDVIPAYQEELLDHAKAQTAPE